MGSSKFYLKSRKYEIFKHILIGHDNWCDIFKTPIFSIIAHPESMGYFLSAYRVPTLVYFPKKPTSPEYSFCLSIIFWKVF